MDELKWIWHFCFGHELHQWCIGSYTCYHWYFKAPNIIGVALVEIVKPLLAKFKLTKKNITYVKDKGSNLNTLATSFSIIISCEPRYNWRHHLQGFILDMQCPKLINMPPMMLSFKLAWKKCLWRMPNKLYKRL